MSKSGPSEVERRLAAVLAADVVAYTRLMHFDELWTVTELKACQTIIARVVGAHSGRIVDTAGDSILAEFPSVVAAVDAALIFQTEIATRPPPAATNDGMRFRVGIHIGDLLLRDGTIYGDGINIASRLQVAAQPGGVLVSQVVGDQVRQRRDIALYDAGFIELKNVDEPIAAFHARRSSTTDALTTANTLSERSNGRTVAERRPIEEVRNFKAGVLALVPFEVNVAHKRWSLFASHFTDELAANLSRFRNLVVISTYSSARAAKEFVGSRQLADRLGARYLVHGSVTTIGDRLQVRATLVDSVSDAQIWSERFDEEVKDIFSVVDAIASRLSSALSIRIEHVVREDVRLSSFEALRSYETLLHGYELCAKHTRASNELAKEAFRRAVELRPSMSRAYAGLSKAYNLEWRYRWSEQPTRSLDLALEVAGIAIELDKLDARGYSELGFAQLYRRHLDESLRSYSRALDLNPNDADVLAEFGDAQTYNGNPLQAISLLAHARRLNPICPDWYFWCEGGAYFQLGDFERCIAVLGEMADPTEASRLLAASFAHLGKKADAEHYAALVMLKHPNFRTGDWITTQPFRNENDNRSFFEGLRLAGLP